MLCPASCIGCKESHRSIWFSLRYKHRRISSDALEDLSSTLPSGMPLLSSAAGTLSRRHRPWPRSPQTTNRIAFASRYPRAYEPLSACAPAYYSRRRGISIIYTNSCLWNVSPYFSSSLFVGAPNKNSAFFLVFFFRFSTFLQRCSLLLLLPCKQQRKPLKASLVYSVMVACVVAGVVAGGGECVCFYPCVAIYMVGKIFKVTAAVCVEIESCKPWWLSERFGPSQKLRNIT